MTRFNVLAAIALVCSACGGHAVVKTTTFAGENGVAYDVHGQPLYLECTGQGAPAVVLEAGLGGDHFAWDIVQPRIAATTRVCSYDRSGLSYSMRAPRRATAREKVSDLHDLLAAADVRPPFVLVGHSYGGMLVRVYASLYRDDVAGVVLLDSSHPDQSRRLLAALPKRAAGDEPALRELRAGLLDRSPLYPEGVNWAASSDETRAAGQLGDIPLLVVTAGEQDVLPGLPSAVGRALVQTWFDLQDDLARLSTNSMHVMAVYSPHSVMSALGQPELVVRGVRAVVRAVRENRQLPPCRTLFKPPGAKCLAIAPRR